ncbi:MAG TPA: M20 family metallopeptidase [Candidatus Acidoferrales bacterium]|jgi:glutamate carboxypeptidase|nr:M20 family metallopeptidase [Candidatus Acidoferrales bacterium]
MKTPSATLQCLEWLRTRETAMTRLLGEFVRVESPSTDKAAVDRLGRRVTAEWRRRGASVSLLKQRERGDHVRAEWNPAGKNAKRQILVLGHMDTVYELGTLARTPFRLSRGRARGPGTFDMKGGLVIALFAADALVARGFVPPKRIVFLWTSDEEIGSKTSQAAIEREARRSDAVLVLEPAAGPQGDVKTGRKGVGEIEIIATGRTSHAGLNPEDGINAIEEIALQIARISRWNQPRRGTTVNAGIIAGGTRTNVIPDQARVIVDVRAARAAEMRGLERKFHALRPILRGAKLEVRGGFNRPPMERKVGAPLYARARALSREMGLSLGEAFVGGGSDGNFTAALGVPTLDGLGAVGEGAHSPDENVLIRALTERAALLAGLLLEEDS